jgi:hypothetical protein
MKTLCIVTSILTASLMSFHCGQSFGAESPSDGAWGLIIIGLALMVWGMQESE